MYTKDFTGWHNVKVTLDARGRGPTFQEREIWWCSIGVNVGHEADGKGRQYNRPVLVLKKFNNRLFWGVPLTTQVKDNRFYHPITFKGKTQCIMLTHLRLWEGRRLSHKMGQLSEKQFQEIKQAVKGLL